jgi:hypothetical protein
MEGLYVRRPGPQVDGKWFGIQTMGRSEEECAESLAQSVETGYRRR